MITSHEDFEDAAAALALIEHDTIRGMHVDAAVAGITQMLTDLGELAERDGCIAAAWAVDFAMSVARYCMKEDAR